MSRAIDNEFIYTFPNTIEEIDRLLMVLHYQCINEYERNNALWKMEWDYGFCFIPRWFLFQYIQTSTCD